MPSYLCISFFSLNVHVSNIAQCKECTLTVLTTKSPANPLPHFHVSMHFSEQGTETWDYWVFALFTSFTIQMSTMFQKQTQLQKCCSLECWMMEKSNNQSSQVLYTIIKTLQNWQYCKLFKSARKWSLFILYSFKLPFLKRQMHSKYFYGKGKK
jgi:hypothetical protein